MAARFATDTNIFDKVVETDATLDLVRALAASDQLELVVLEVQERQLAEVPDPAKRARIALVPRTQVHRTSGRYGEAVYGHARYGSTGRIEANEGDDDNSIAGEALARGLPLVSEDCRLLRRASEHGVEVWDWQRFEAYIRTL